MTPTPNVRVQSETVPISVALLTRLDAIGVNVVRVLERAGVPRPTTSIGTLHLDTRLFFAVWSAIGEVAGDEEIGIRIGSHAFDGKLDLASTCALHSKDLADAFKKLSRYKRLTCPEDVRVDVTGGEAAVTFHWLLADAFAPDLLVDAIFASTVKLAGRASGGAIVPKRIELARRTKRQAQLARHFKCDIRFDAPIDALIFSSADMKTPFVTHDERMVHELVPGLDAELASVSKNQTFDGQVDAALLRGMRGQRPSVETLAAELSISPRTLQRRLTQNGTHYQERLDGIRQRVAHRLLENTNLDLGEIAWFLGFEELNSFSRIFNQWEGVTPNRWRALKTSAPSTISL
ncbi:AraC family transcriptional regulator [Caballeronia sordidicola]|uniref:Transcriptional regulator, AraC family n=1 Tax=Caballeronia sordidicola TaxID=196367 RepID=A0A242M376_CABSO|nr:AraC family transcriptional regulator [Caballeronia sordidicola]OTP65602.1 Transcriptional regulator, AraC family [Caballeronia sordidicola]